MIAKDKAVVYEPLSLHVRIPSPSVWRSNS